MSDTETTDAAENTGKAPEFEGDFDADRAKRAITSLRTEVESLKVERDALRADRDAFRDAAEKTGTERDTALAEAVKRAEKAERDLAIAKHDLPDDIVEEFADFLTGTPEEVDAKAARLKARLSPKEDGEPEVKADEKETGKEAEGEKPAAPAVPRRPQAALVPGTGGDTPKPFDAKAVAERARG